MKTILKWTGGKTNELPFIKEYLPKDYNKYIEPFLGGGAVFFDLENSLNIVNDFNKELILFYKNIKNDKFYSFFKDNLTQYQNILNAFNKYNMNTDPKHIYLKSEKKSNSYLEYLFEYLNDYFLKTIKYSKDIDLSVKKVNPYKYNKKTKDLLKQDKLKLFDFEEMFKASSLKYNSLEEAIKYILKKELNNKAKIINKIYWEEYSKVLQTILCSSLYYLIREAYNCLKDNFNEDILYQKLFYWFILRELSYSGMFRFTKTGNFNVPYGGQSYNNKNLLAKLEQITFLREQNFYKNTLFFNLDFDSFFQEAINKNFIDKDDFIFLDPPYDSEFSQYNKEKDFTKEDQINLRNWLLKIHERKTKFIILIKETDFIFNLYNEYPDVFNIIKFDKKYNVNFKNRNAKEVIHLLIKNY